MLSRVAAFLPQIADANRKLEEAVARDPLAADRYNVENISTTDGPIIEMVGCGLVLRRSFGLEFLPEPDRNSVSVSTSY